MKMESANIRERNIDKIAELFPNVITETKDEEGNIKKGIDFQLLKNELTNNLVEQDQERYEFNWVGKKRAMAKTYEPTQKTLRPIKSKSKKWDSTNNIFVEGNNIDFLKIAQESYLNKIKMIYIDPPYNTGNDLIYNDKFNISKEEYDEEISYKDEDGNINFKQNTKTNPRYHSDWLNSIFPTLQLSRNLLREDGVIFISIDDNENANLRKICDEIFGEDNFIANLVWHQGRKSASKAIAINHEYCLVYCKNKNYLFSLEKNENYWKEKKQGLDKIYEIEKQLRSKYGNDYEKITKELREFYKSLNAEDPARAHKHYNNIDEKGIYFAADASAPDKPETRLHEPLIHPITQKQTKTPRLGWRYTKSTLEKLLAENKIHFGKDETTVPCVKKYLTETEFEVSNSVFYKDGRGASLRLGNLIGKNIFKFPKDEEIIKKFINFCVEPYNEDIVLDFYAGSGTTAQSVLELNAEDGGNRKFILVQLDEAIDNKSVAYKEGYKNISDIAIKRIDLVGDKINEHNNIDVGYRYFNIDSTNMKDIYYSANEYSQDMIATLESNIKEDRTDLDLLYGVMLDWGLPLSLKHQTKEIENAKVHIVDYGSLVACFEDSINDEVVKEIAKSQPLRVVFRDSSFRNSPNKINVTEIFRFYAPNTTVKVI